MGSIIAKQMDAAFEKQKEFQAETMRLQTMRQLSMQNLMRERAMAMQIAGARDTFMWLAGFTAFLGAVAAIVHVRKKDPRAAIPLVPLSYITAYWYDLAYGDKIANIRREAETILLDDPGLLSLPNGMPLFDEIETRRETVRKEEALLPNELFL